MKGINGIGSPFALLRRSLTEKFRNSLGDEFNLPIRPSSPGPLVRVPKRTIINKPKEFETVQETYVDLQLGNEKKPGSVPGFDQYWANDWWGDGRYIQRDLILETLPSGIYLVQVVQGNSEAQAILQVSSHAVQVKQSTSELLIRVIDRKGQPVAKLNAAIRLPQGTWQKLDGQTNSDGELFYKNSKTPLPGNLVVKVGDGNSDSLTESDFLTTKSSDLSFYILTDRPMFRPGDEVQFKGIIRKNGTSGPEMEKPIAGILAPDDVQLQELDGTNAVKGQNLTKSDFGTISGRFAMPKTAEPGTYQVVTKWGGNKYAGELRVQDYVKPTFYIEMDSVEGQLRPGQTFKFKLKATRFSGGAPSGARYEFYVYRKKYESPQWVDEGGGGLSTGMNYHGGTETTTALAQPLKIYSSLDNREISEGDDSWETAPQFNADGEATVNIDLTGVPSTTNQEWIYALMLRAKDSDGAFATLSENYFQTIAEANVALGISTTLWLPGAPTPKASMKVLLPDGRPAGIAKGFVAATVESAEGKVTSLGDMPFLTDATGSAAIDLPASGEIGVFKLKAFVTHLESKELVNRGVSREEIIIVGKGAGEKIVEADTVSLYAHRSTILRGEKEQVLALLPKGWGNGEAGTIWLSLAGTQIFSSKALQAKGRSLIFDVEGLEQFGTGFYATLTVPMPGGKFLEQSLSFRVVPKEKILELQIDVDKEIAEPLAPVTIALEAKDQTGAPAANVEIAVSVVDRAVLVLQPEFRPSLFEFFYPLARLNQMTFYSDDLQGYGYADEIRRPNFRLGSLKPRTTKFQDNIRDTAGFFPHIVTGPDGKAKVTLTMPGNVTEWVITATAIDKIGRIGEKRKKFRTATTLGIYPQIARFMRHGDKLTIPVRIANQTGALKKVTMEATLSSAFKVADGDAVASFDVKPNSELSRTVTIESLAETGTATASFTLKSDTNPAFVSGAEILLAPAGLSQIISSQPSLPGQNLLATVLPAGATVDHVKIQASYGLLGAALDVADRLATYPYGCIEQLTHTTIPNLVVYDLLKKSGVKDTDLGAYSELLKKVNDQGSVGLRKIVTNQKENGSFSMWTSDSSGSEAITLMVLDGLRLAQELGFKEEVGDSIQKAEQFLKSTNTSWITQASAGEMPYFLATQARSGLIYGEQSVAYVENITHAPAPSYREITAVLQILAGARGRSDESLGKRLKGIVSEPQVKALVAKLEISLRDFLDGKTAESPNVRQAGYFDFEIGSSAFVSSALGTLHNYGALNPELLKSAKNYLISNMRNGMWRSTFESAEVIFNVRKIISEESEQLKKLAGKSALMATLRDGSILGELAPAIGGFRGEFKVQGKTTDIFPEIKIAGLPADARAYASIRASTPNSMVRVGSEQGIKVERNFYRVEASGAKKLEDLTQLKIGDIVISEVVVLAGTSTDPNLKPSKLLVVEDPLPALAEPVLDDQTYLADAGVKRTDHDQVGAKLVETYRYPDRTTRAYQVIWPEGSQQAVKSLSVWRVAYKGQAAVNAAEAFDMYDDRLRGNSVPKQAMSN
jgi:hypothetical protein